MKHSKTLTPTRSIAMLVLAGAITLPLQGCNEELVPSESAADTTAPQIDALQGAAREKAIVGGLYYDEWAAEVPTTPPAGKQVPPSTTNLLMTYAAAGTTGAASITGGASWRCARCHGWDYKGADGQYGPWSSNRYTGFPGVIDAAELSIEDLVEFLTNGKTYPANVFGTNAPPTDTQLHNFGNYMSDEEIEGLAYFVKFGTLNTNDYIGKFTGETYGDAASGAALFASTGRCAECHDDDGTGGLPVGDTVGKIGNENPWEILHKIRFGQPASSPTMPSGYNSGLSTEDAVDIMTHTQTLPES